MSRRVQARIYIEGGGPGKIYDTLCRQGWQAFFQGAGLAGRLPRVIRGESREQTFDLFRIAVSRPAPGVLPLLLVDSEGAITKGSGVWLHLEVQDKWRRPDGVDDDQAFLMVQVMETWFLADAEQLQTFFGSRWRPKTLSNWPDLEKVPKQTVLTCLEKATAACAKPYAKGKVAFELLQKIDPQKVEAKCPHARRLLDRLRAL